MKDRHTFELRYGMGFVSLNGCGRICADGLRQQVHLPYSVRSVDVVFSKRAARDKFALDWLGRFSLKIPDSEGPVYVLLFPYFAMLLREAMNAGYSHFHFEYDA